MSPHIDHEYAAVVSDCDIMGYAELAVIIAETTETGEDSAVQINLGSPGPIEAAFCCYFRCGNHATQRLVPAINNDGPIARHCDRKRPPQFCAPPLSKELTRAIEDLHPRIGAIRL